MSNNILFSKVSQKNIKTQNDIALVIQDSKISVSSIDVTNLLKNEYKNKNNPIIKIQTFLEICILYTKIK